MAMSFTRLAWPQFCPDVSTDFVSNPERYIPIAHYTSSLFGRRVRRARNFGSRILEDEDFI